MRWRSCSCCHDAYLRRRRQSIWSCCGGGLRGNFGRHYVNCHGLLLLRSNCGGRSCSGTTWRTGRDRWSGLCNSLLWLRRREMLGRHLHVVSDLQVQQWRSHLAVKSKQKTCINVRISHNIAAAIAESTRAEETRQQQRGRPATMSILP